MLSIVICHHNEKLFSKIKINIASTIGIHYELIMIDNTNNNYSIETAYNEGVQKSKYGIVCFMHEDILFHKADWGQKVVNHFKDPEVGMIGVLGGLSQSKFPSAWWYNNYFNKSAQNLLMRDKKNNQLYHHFSNPFNEKITEAVIVDGLWFCIRKSLFNKISFDDRTFTGFHLYDADISMQVLQYSKIFIVYDILVEHLWSGKISKDYYVDLIKFSKKWNHQLPLQNKKIKTNYMDYYNWHALRSFILELETKDFSRKEVNNFLHQYYPIAKRQYNSQWFRSFFFLSKIIGFANANRIYYRFEKISGFCNYTAGEKYWFKEFKTQ